VAVGDGEAAGPVAEASAGPVDPLTVEVEREALRAAVQRPQLAGADFDALPPDAFALPLHRTLRRAIADAGAVAAAPAGAAWVDAIRAAAPDDHHRALVGRLAVEPLRSTEEALPRYVGSLVLRVHELWVGRQLDTVMSRLRRTDAAAEPATVQPLQVELVRLEQQRRDLRERALGPA
jgi:DNA primase